MTQTEKGIRAGLEGVILARFHGTFRLPFTPGDNRYIAVKIIDSWASNR
ncbi:MAG: hypothetical protein WBN85_09155 [Candidatus Macondimonas sp.]